jgi:hypothetical protein
VVRVIAPRVGTGRGSDYLVLARPGAAVAEEVLLEAGAPPAPHLADQLDDAGTTARLVAAVAEPAGRSPQVRVERLDSAAAAEFAAQLAPALAELARLHRQLARRGRQR